MDVEQAFRTLSFDEIIIELKKLMFDPKSSDSVKSKYLKDKNITLLLNENNKRDVNNETKENFAYNLIKLKDDDEYTFKIAVSYFKINNYSIASRLLTLIKRRSNAHNNLMGLIVLNDGDKAAATELFEKCVKKNPNEEGTWANLVLSLRKRGLYLESAKKAREGLRNFPNSWILQLSVFRAYASIGDREQMAQTQKKIQLIHSNNPNCLWSFYGNANTIDDARSLLKKILELPDHPKIATDHFQLVNFKTTDGQKAKFSNSGYSDTFFWLQSINYEFVLISNRWAFYDYCANISTTKDRCYFEFGVFTGASIRYNSRHFDKLFGFDTFEGLPENWWGEKIGSYSAESKIPDVPGATFVKGLFSETVRPFLINNKIGKAAVINFDADMYSSTLTALEASEDHIDEKTILIFDEFIINESWKHDEYKALEEFCSARNLSYIVRSVCIFSKQVAVQLTGLASSHEVD